MWGTLFQFAVLGLLLGAMLLSLARWLMRRLGALRWRARRPARAHGLLCVEPVTLAFDPELD